MHYRGEKPTQNRIVPFLGLTNPHTVKCMAFFPHILPFCLLDQSLIDQAKQEAQINGKLSLRCCLCQKAENQKFVEIGKTVNNTTCNCYNQCPNSKLLTNHFFCDLPLFFFFCFHSRFAYAFILRKCSSSLNFSGILNEKKSMAQLSRIPLLTLLAISQYFFDSVYLYLYQKALFLMLSVS